MNDPERERAATAMCEWLSRHFDCFLALARDADGEPSHGAFGPLAELSLALMALTAPRYAVSIPTVHAWATDLARELGCEATRIGAGLRWDRYDAALERNREAGLAWLFIPATEMAAGAATGFGRRLAADLGGPIVATNPDFLLFLELLGVRDCTIELERYMRLIVDRTLCQPDVPRCPDLYDATHGLFYLTRFGRLPRRCGRLPDAFQDRLRAAAVWQAGEGDSDLAAEIVASLLYAGSPMDGRLGEVVERIIACTRSDGGVVTRRGPSDTAVESFRGLYHPTLVSLMALSEAQHAAKTS